MQPITDLNEQYAQGGSIQFGAVVQNDIPSNQNSGQITFDNSYNQNLYSNPVSGLISQYDCQQSNYQCQEQESTQIEYQESESLQANLEIGPAPQINQDKVQQDNIIDLANQSIWNSEIENPSTDVLEQLDDAVSEEFKLNLAKFIEKKNTSTFSLFQRIYGNIQESIQIPEIKNFENQTQKLCEQFPNLKYSEIVLALQLIENFQYSQQFLQTLNKKQEKPILRELNELILNEQKAKENGDINELQISKQKVNEFKKTHQTLIIEDLSLNQIAIKIIEENNYKFDIKKCDQQTLVSKINDFKKNRNQIIEIKNQKAKVIEQYQTDYINEQECIQQLKQVQMEKQRLEKIGMNLFLDLLMVQDGVCKIQFNGFLASEIENILLGVFDKLESYKLYNKLQQINLQIILDKGLNSNNNKSIISLMIYHYICQYLQQKVEIKDGKIDVIV